MLLLILILLAFSTWQATETVFEGDIFEPLRNLGERLNDHPNLLVRVVTLPIRASTCFFCLSHWTALFLTPVALVAAFCEGVLFYASFAVLVWLSTIAVANVLRCAVSHFKKSLIEYETEELEEALLKRLGPDYEVRKVNE